ncbi:MAG: tetraacyldisaccharide 4'-kinase [Burkholderiaceae bacterium]|jgi:tetraacyldisaccharide 4'-kinase|nr:MAG: tetraacyldisaccharide 4'-kinase [Burkholderiaceae bacterium]
MHGASTRPLASALERTLLRTWTQRGALARLLWPLAQLFGVLAAARRALYRCGMLTAQRASVPLPVVVVVGNVVAGGAGKTPTVIALVRHWQARGLRVGVISRGHGRRGAGCREVRDDSAAFDVGDEPLLIRRATGAPVVVAARRIDAARALMQRHPAIQVLVSDDGLQHYALARDIAICLFDDRGIGNGWLLPAGPLREPWPRRADLVLHSGLQPAFPGFRATRRLADHAVHQGGVPLPLAALRGQGVTAVAAIAHPDAFFDMLRAAGLTLTRTVALHDHYGFDSWNCNEHGGDPLVCTEKDAVKLWPRCPHALAVPLEFQPEAGFFAAADALLDAKLSSAHAAREDGSESVERQVDG